MKKPSTSVSATIPAVGLSVALSVGMLPPAGLAFANPGDDVVETIHINESATANQAPSNAARSQGKEETAYVSADSTGAVQGIYVVNMFDNGIGGVAEDPANYIALRNLSTDDVLVQEDNRVKLATSASDPTYYQGELDAATVLPWNISVNYWLDGKQVEPKELSGASGNLRIALGIESTKEVSPARDFAVSYVLQAQATFNEEFFRITKTDDVTMARAGNNSVATCMMLPDESRTFVIEGEARDFSYPGWQVSAMPLSLALDVKEQDTSELDKRSSELKDATGQLADGSDELHQGTKDLLDDSNSLSEGADALKDGSSSLVEGSSELSSGALKVSKGLDQLSSGASELSDASDKLTDAWGEFSAGVHTLNQGAETLQKGSDTFKERVKSSRAAAETAAAGLTQAQAKYAQAMATVQEELGKATPDPVVIDAALQNVNKSVMQIGEASDYAGAANALNTVEEGYAELDEGIKNIAKGTGKLDLGKDALTTGLSNYIEGVLKVSKGISDADDGAARLAQGSKSLLSGAQKLDGGVTQVQGGASQLSDGAKKLQNGSLALSDSMAELRDSVKDIDKEILDELQNVVDEKLGAGFKKHSFVVPSNTNVSQVQFVYVLDGIDEHDDNQDGAAGDADNSSDSIVDRFIALFKF